MRQAGRRSEWEARDGIAGVRVASSSLTIPNICPSVVRRRRRRRPPSSRSPAALCCRVSLAALARQQDSLAQTLAGSTFSLWSNRRAHTRTRSSAHAAAVAAVLPFPRVNEVYGLNRDSVRCLPITRRLAIGIIC